MKKPGNRPGQISGKSDCLSARRMPSLARAKFSQDPRSQGHFQVQALKARARQGPGARWGILTTHPRSAAKLGASKPGQGGGSFAGAYWGPV